VEQDRDKFGGVFIGEGRVVPIIPKGPKVLPQFTHPFNTIRAKDGGREGHASSTMNNREQLVR
jgi:hypothetical protein